MTPSHPLLRRAVRAVATVAAVGVLTVSAGGYALTSRYDAKIERVEVFEAIPTESRPTPHPIMSTEPLNVLVVGIDNREGMTRAERNALHLGGGDYGNQTDTIMLVHIGRDAEHITVVSLPRDSLVTIPEWTDADGTVRSERQNRINAAFTLGGPSLLVRTVTKNTGIPIDHYVGVSFKGFVAMVDAVEGVDVCLTAPIKDNPKYTTLDLPAGKSTIRGAMALSFVRARHVGTDFGRIQRQQQFAASLLKKATSLGIMTDPRRLDAFVTAALESLQVDERFDRNEILALARRLSAVPLNRIEFARLPIADDDYWLPGSDLSSLVLWGEKGSKRIFDAIRDDVPLAVQRGTTNPSPSPSASSPQPLYIRPSQITLSVLNGSGIAGLGSKAAEQLAGLGFRIPADPAKADTPPQVESTIRYGPGVIDAARTLQAAVPGSVLLERPSYGSKLVLTVGSSYTEAKAVTITDPSTVNEPGDLSTEQAPVLASSAVCE